MATLNEMTRDDLNAHAATVGIEDAAGFATKPDLIAAIEGGTTDAPSGPAVSDSQQAEIRAHLADPGRVPLPPGVSINFGDPIPYRVASES